MVVSASAPVRSDEYAAEVVMDALPDNLSSIDAYFAAWNARDPEAVVATFAEGGTYLDPTVTEPLTASELGEHVQALVSAFPDLNFEIVTVAPTGENTVVARWLMRGTNTGSLRGLPATGKTVALPGVDVIALTDAKIGSIEGYFDRQTMVEQLGLQVLVQPHRAGPFQFGYAVRVAGTSRQPPGAVSLTWIDTRSQEEADEVRTTTRSLVAELTAAPGFIGWMGAGVAGRYYTITFWESEDAVQQVLRSSAHRGAVKRFFNEDFCAAVGSGVWSAHHLNPPWVRCPSCSRVADGARPSNCPCGEPLPDPPHPW